MDACCWLRGTAQSRSECAAQSAIKVELSTGTNPSCSLADSTNVDTGYPSSVVLEDGRVLTFYYAVGSKTQPQWGVHCGVVEYRVP